MKGLSVSEPWASALVHDIKSIETRTWFTRFRGQIAIHASARYNAEQKELAKDYVESLLPNLTIEKSLGKIIGVVTLYDCVPTESVMSVPIWDSKLGDFTPGRWAWLLHKAVAFKPEDQMAVRGMLGLWTVPSNLEDKINELVSA